MPKKTKKNTAESAENEAVNSAEMQDAKQSTPRAADGDTPEETGNTDSDGAKTRAERAAESPKGEEQPAGEDQEELQAKYVRLAADFQNFRRRTENEKKEIYAYANEGLVRELLTVTDNFDRAVDQAKDCTDQAFADGIVLIYKQLKEVLEKFGTQEILALGEEFNPNLHHAVMMDPSGTGESGRVTEVLQKGFTLNGRVVRPSMVKVAE